MGDDGAQRRGERVIGGRYRLVERIGSGGMGTVWRAHDRLVSREVAVKQPRLPGDPEDEAHRRAAHRLHREARAAARVDHPSAVAIHDVVEEDGLPWIVMELVRGESLHETLQRGPLAPAEAARVGLAVLGALRAAHAVGIVHRDVKPANVLLGPHRRVVLTDFGIAHVQGEESLTASGEFVGSLEFVAPERMSGRGAGPASDLWSLGVLLYAAVEGWSPFRRTALESTLAAILTTEPPEPRRAGALGPLMLRLLAKDPARRPDADQVAAVLEAVASEDPTLQDASRLEEFGDDIGTARLGARPRRAFADPEADTLSAPEADTVPDPASGTAPDPTSGSVPGSVPGPASDTAPDPASGTAPSPLPGPASDPAPAPVPGPASDPAPAPVPGPAPGTAPDPVPAQVSAVRRPPRRPLHRRPVPIAALGGLLLGTAGLGFSLLTGPDGGAATQDPRKTTARHPSSPEPSPTPTSTPAPATTPALDGWTPHHEKDMGATLALPPEYEEFARQGNDTIQPRAVEYAAGSVQVRLTQWDKSPGTPMKQAKQHATTFEFYGNARTRHTPTSFQGWDAVRSDSRYGDEDLRYRVIELLFRTDDGRFYELRVEMPEDAAEEKKGEAVFAGARDRLVVAASRAGAQRP